MERISGKEEDPSASSSTPWSSTLSVSKSQENKFTPEMGTECLKYDRHL